MRKYLKDMKWEETKKLIENCDELHDDLFDRAWNTAWSWCEDYLDGFPGRYEIGGQYDYLTISEDTYTMTYANFEAWFDEAQHKYCFVSDEEERVVREFIRYSKIWHKLEYEVEAKEKDYDYVTAKMEELKEESEQIILDRLKSEYDACYETDVLCEELGCCAEYEDAFIVDGDYTHIYKHINGYYVKAHDEIVA